MDVRILMAAVVGLVLLSAGGFYYALSPKSSDAVVAPPTSMAASPATPTEPAPAAAPANATPDRPETVAPATVAAIEAELARSEHADLQALLKRHFAEEYQELVEFLVRRRNEGVAGDAAAQEMLARFQDMMRPKLKFAAAARVALIDKLADNEIELFHALGTEGAGFCLKVLGKDSMPATTPLPDSIRRLMRLGTLYRYEAIVDGMPQSDKPVDPLKPEEMSAFEASLGRNGMTMEDVRSGAFLNEPEPGKPCLMIERLYRTISGLDSETRRKLYAGMFFMGRDK
jgi:hypothetical protein